ncbi:MAG: hypothetical protein RMK29_00490 [Myxococcales bacterium]|nr:hypothetical protein [Myxococcota bacterium]MDW8280154.1 hypothetical protein [Myxococcales bacterium]
MRCLRVSAACALLLLWSRPGRGDASSPLEAMREAAEAAAEVDPERVPLPRLLLPPWLTRAALEQVRQEAVREAVRTEVEREWADRRRSPRPERVPPGHGGPPRGKDMSAQARSAAAQAQDVARNHDVARERGRGRPEHPLGPMRSQTEKVWGSP